MFTAMLLVLAAAADAPPDLRVRPEAAELAPLLGIDHPAEAPREELARRVLQASFEVDSAIADLQEEQAALAELLSAIRADKDSRMTVLNVAAGIFAAGAAVGTGMTLRSDTATAGTWITTVTSGVGALLAIYVALAPTRGMPPLQSRLNLLAPLFDRPPAAGRYPRIVWAYLDGAAPGERLSRRQQLVARWVKLGRIDEGSSPEAQRRIDALCAPVSQRAQVDADLLQDRTLMLGDVRATVATMKIGLRSLLEVPPPRQASR